MSDANPFQSTSIPGIPREGQPDVELALRESTDLLAQTKPWVRFVSVLGFFSTTCAMAFMLLAFFAGGDPFPNTPGPMAVMLPIQITAMFAVCLLVYFIPSLLLWNYASRIADFLIDKSSQALAAAVGAQRSFWKYVGITSAVGIILYMGFFIIAGMLGALR